MLATVATAESSWRCLTFLCFILHESRSGTSQVPIKISLNGRWQCPSTHIYPYQKNKNHWPLIYVVNVFPWLFSKPASVRNKRNERNVYKGECSSSTQVVISRTWWRDFPFCSKLYNYVHNQQVIELSATKPSFVWTQVWASFSPPIRQFMFPSCSWLLTIQLFPRNVRTCYKEDAEDVTCCIWKRDEINILCKEKNLLLIAVPKDPSIPESKGYYSKCVSSCKEIIGK